MAVTTGSIAALDVGTVRIGVALASRNVRLARPFATLANDEKFLSSLQILCQQEAVDQLVVGLPRNLDGNPTPQTVYVENFVKKLQLTLTIPIAWQDEAVTSRQAEAELMARKKPYTKADIDALAATYILEDYLRESVVPSV